MRTVASYWALLGGESIVPLGVRLTSVRECDSAFVPVQNPSGAISSELISYPFLFFDSEEIILLVPI